jgi:diaminohydroxyphosphoribosylaminopyrimidine deaminase / 5-amino-6-(5-phosphoribosylamino)uracil reductase
MSEHINNMMQCLLLATQGAGYVAPNPLVGSMLVHNGEMIGAGYHMQYGTEHAEVNCLASVANKDLIPESTLYVNLEPCNHTGQTPPCTEAIIKAEIKKVVIGTRDNNAIVSGNGIARLKEAGIEVIEGVLKAQCEAVNRRFFTYHEKKRPYIILKWAQSSDGFISDQTNERTIISTEATNKIVHSWRAQEDAILVGYQTALLDNPQLNARLVDGRNPVRIIIDLENTLPKNLNVFDNSQPTLIFNKHVNEVRGATRFISITNLNEIIFYLYEHKTQSILIEGGAKTLQAFIDNNLWDEARIITNIRKINKGLMAPHLINPKFMYEDKKSEDTISYYKHVKNIWL